MFKLDLSIIKIAKKYILLKFNKRYSFIHPAQKYKLDMIISELFYVLKSGVSWNDYRGPINNKTLYNHYNFFYKNHIFKHIYILLLNKYFKNNKTSKLKNQYIDTCFIKNINGIDKIGRNKYYKNKNVSKLSIISDINGIPISILLKKGNKHDSQFIKEHIDKMLIITNTKKYKNHNRYKQNFMGDKGYDSKEKRTYLINKGYTLIIPYNKRNTKNPDKIKKLTKIEKKKYKKRIKIENVFCWITKNKKIATRNEKYAISYLNFVYMALIKIIIKRITK